MFIRFTLFIMWLVPSVLLAANPILLSEQQSQYIIGPRARVFSDSTNQLTLTNVLQLPSSRFSPVYQSYPSVSNLKPAYWYLFSLCRQKSNSQFLLEVAFGNIYQIDLYVVDTAGTVVHKRAGDRLGTRSRLISFNTYVLPLPLRQNERYSIYVRIHNPSLHGYFPLIIHEETAFLAHAQEATLLWGFYWGILALMFMYHIIIWGFTGERGYLYLGIYLLTYIGFEMSRGSNLGVRYVWPKSSWLVTHGLEFFSTLVLFAFTLFYSKMLSLRQTVSPLFYTLIGLCVLGGLLGLGRLTAPDNLSKQLLSQAQTHE